MPRLIEWGSLEYAIKQYFRVEERRLARVDDKEFAELNDKVTALMMAIPVELDTIVKEILDYAKLRRSASFFGGVAMAISKPVPSPKHRTLESIGAKLKDNETIVMNDLASILMEIQAGKLIVLGLPERSPVSSATVTSCGVVLRIIPNAHKSLQRHGGSSEDSTVECTSGSGATSLGGSPLPEL